MTFDKWFDMEGSVMVEAGCSAKIVASAAWTVSETEVLKIDGIKLTPQDISNLLSSYTRLIDAGCKAFDMYEGPRCHYCGVNLEQDKTHKENCSHVEARKLALQILTR